VTKLLAKELMFSRDIKPPYTNANADQWNVKMPISIRYLVIIYVVYQREEVNYISNMIALTFMKVEEGPKVDWA
jgi:hypothetical protein